MGRQGRYPAEVRERAVRLLFEQQPSHESQWSAIESIAAATSRQVVYDASSGFDYAACFLSAGFSAFGSSSGSSRLMVM